MTPSRPPSISPMPRTRISSPTSHRETSIMSFRPTPRVPTPKQKLSRTSCLTATMMPSVRETVTVTVTVMFLAEGQPSGADWIWALRVAVSRDIARTSFPTWRCTRRMWCWRIYRSTAWSGLVPSSASIRTLWVDLSCCLDMASSVIDPKGSR